MEVRLTVAKRRHQQLVQKAFITDIGMMGARDVSDLAAPLDVSSLEERGAGGGRGNDGGAASEALREAAPTTTPRPAEDGRPLPKRLRIAAPPGVCRACFREELCPGHFPGVAHTYSTNPAVGVCKREKNKGKGKGARKQKAAALVPLALREPANTDAGGGEGK